MKKSILLIAAVIFKSSLMIAQVVPQGFLVNPPQEQTVTIGTQIWMKYNLNVSNYQDGTAIEGADIAFNRNVTTPAWCYYDHNSLFNATYGKLYNGYAIRAPKNICPVGFRVPTQADFNTLSTFIGTAQGGKLKEVGSAHWTSNSTSTDIYGFTALPGGYMGNANSSSNMYVQAYFWSATPITGGGSTNYIRYLINTSGNFTESTAFVLEGGASVRCIKN